MTRQSSTNRLTNERDHWKRMFNRLDAAITHHKRDAERDDVPEIHDEALWAARDRILQASADHSWNEGVGSNPSRRAHDHA